MQTLLIFLTILIAMIIIIVVSFLPRSSQQFYHDTNLSIGKSGYWETDFWKKVVLLIASIFLFLLVIIFMIQSN